MNKSKLIQILLKKVFLPNLVLCVSVTKYSEFTKTAFT